AAAVDTDRAGAVRVHDPLRDAHDVRAAVADLAAAEIEQPSELAVGVFLVIRNVARRAEPGVIVELRRRRGIGCPVAGGTGVMPTGDFPHRADLAIANVGAGMIRGRLGAPLRA